MCPADRAPSEQVRIRLCAFVLTLTIAALTLVKSARDAVFLSRFGVAEMITTPVDVSDAPAEEDLLANTAETIRTSSLNLAC